MREAQLLYRKFGVLAKLFEVQVATSNLQATALRQRGCLRRHEGHVLGAQALLAVEDEERDHHAEERREAVEDHAEHRALVR